MMRLWGLGAFMSERGPNHAEPRLHQAVPLKFLPAPSLCDGIHDLTFEQRERKLQRSRCKCPSRLCSLKGMSNTEGPLSSFSPGLQGFWLRDSHFNPDHSRNKNRIVGLSSRRDFKDPCVSVHPPHFPDEETGLEKRVTCPRW